MKTPFEFPAPSELKNPATRTRLFINICWILGLRFIPIGFDRVGADFFWKHGTAIYVWPWRKDRKHRWIDLSCEGGFNSLKEIDEFYKEIDKYLEEHP